MGQHTEKTAEAIAELDLDENASDFLHGLVSGLMRQKKKSDAFGETTIHVTWKSGDPTLVRVIEEATHKFERKPKGPKPSRT
jgi:hypothetical protein